MSRLIRSLLLMVLGLAFSTPLSAQQLWREGSNVSGRSLTGEDEAEAVLLGSFTSGGFKLPSEGRQLWSAGAGARAEKHFKDLVLTGDFSFDLVSGKEMYGSMFTHPGYYPIDVLEFTPGPKVRQTYGIGGSLAWINGSNWIPGVSLHFEGENFAKRKDIRHTTYRQELELLPSLLYRGEGWAAGATFHFRKDSESIQAEQIGASTSDSYYAFLDKGLRYGAYQVWDGSGIHLKEAGVDRLPVKEIRYGMGLQASIGDVFYGEAEYWRSSGEVGEKGYTWFRFPGFGLDAALAAAFTNDKGRHVFGIGYNWRRQDNHESVIEKVTTGGVSIPVIYGSNRIFQQEEISITPSYRFESERGWEIAAAVDLSYDHQFSTLLYPFVDQNGAMHLNGTLEAILPLGRFTLNVGVLFRSLLAERLNSLTVVDESLEVTAAPYRLIDWWEKESEAEDATALGGKLSLRYHLPLQGLYLEAGCQLQQAFRIEILEGRNRQTTHLTIGYQF